MGWQLVKESPGTALYGQLRVSSEGAGGQTDASAPRLVLKTFLLNADDVHAYQRLSEQPLPVPGQEVELLGSAADEVAGHAALTRLYARHQAEGPSLFHMQTFFQVGRVVGSMTALGPLTQREVLQPLFEQVRASLRYIQRPRRV